MLVEMFYVRFYYNVVGYFRNIFNIHFSFLLNSLSYLFYIFSSIILFEYLLKIFTLSINILTLYLNLVLFRVIYPLNYFTHFPYFW